MSLTADEIIDRRQLRKKVSFWRIVTFVLIGLVLITAVIFGARDALFSAAQKDHVAKIKISGVITNDEAMLALLDKVGENDKVTSVILNISSPGGSTVGGEATFEAVRKLTEKKPVVTTVGTLATSAGYMVAAATDHVVAHRSSIIGSIGVLFQYADASKLLDNIGVKVEAVKSSPLKAEPSPFNPATPEAIAMIDEVIQDTYVWFVDLVAERRDMTKAEVHLLADGSVFSGNQALQNGLIDAIGGEDIALQWLQEEKGIGEDLKVVEYKPVRSGGGFFENPAGLIKLAELLGIQLSSNDLLEFEKLIRQRVLLDGLVSIWQVPNHN